MHFGTLVIGFICLALRVLGAKKASKAGDAAKPSTVQLIHDKSRLSPVISVSDKTFAQYVTNRPRDYHAVLMLTALNPKYSCSVCVRAKDILKEMAKAYHSQYTFNTSSPHARIAFFSADVDDAPNLFAEMRLESVPHFYILHPAADKAPKAALPSLEVESRAIIDGLPSGLKLLEESTSVSVRLRVDPWPFVVGASLLGLLLSYLTSSAAYDLPGTIDLYRSPSLWAAVSVLCFAVGVSGSIFCVIRSAPLYGPGPGGSLSIFAPQGREQYLLEGVIVAALTLTMAALCHLLRLSTSVRFPLLRHVLVLCCLAAFCTLGVQLWMAYVIKTPWYSLKETLPAELWRAVASSVKKTSGLGKRLWRLSEYWLLDPSAQDPAVLWKKADGLLLDYLKRQIASFRTSS